MKLLFTITYYSPYISGLTICPERIVKELDPSKYSIDILTSQYQKNLSKIEKDKNIRIIRVPYLFKLSKGLIMPQYPLNAFKLVSKSDIVVINLPQFEGFIVAIIAKILKKKLISIYHCEVCLPKTFLNSLVEKALHLANKISLFLSDEIITYTKDYALNSKYLVSYLKKTKYIYPPIPKLKKDNSKLINFKKNIPDKKYIIGVAARLAAEKGIEYLFEAIPLIKNTLGENFIVVIAGPKKPVGEEKYWKKINMLVHKYKKHIHFLGTLSLEEIGYFYSLTDVLVLPSLNSTEAFGMVQVEAMLCGTPVVVSNLPGVRVPIQKTKMGEIAKIGDSKDLAEKIIKVLKNKKEYVKNKDQVDKIFSIKKSIFEYEKIFTRIS